MKTIHVCFGPTNKYSDFMYDGKEEIKEGDRVICEYGNQLQVGAAVSVSEGRKASTAWSVVCKIPVEEFEKRKETERERAAIKKELDAKVKAFQQNNLLEMVCAADPEAACLKKKLDELDA